MCATRANTISSTDASMPDTIRLLKRWTVVFRKRSRMVGISGAAAAFAQLSTRVTEKVYFVRQNRYIVYDENAGKQMKGSTRKFNDAFGLPGSWTRIDAAVTLGEHVNFFNRNSYIKYNIADERVVFGPAYVENDWRGLYSSSINSDHFAPVDWHGRYNAAMGGLGAGNSNMLYIFKKMSLSPGRYKRFSIANNCTTN